MSSRRRRSARKHAEFPWWCPVCSMACRGNGGKTSHKRKHVREWLDGKSMLKLSRATQEKFQGWIRRYALKKKPR